MNVDVTNNDVKPELLDKIDLLLKYAYVVVVDEASFESSSLTSVTGTSLVSMMFVDEMEELRKRFTM